MLAARVVVLLAAIAACASTLSTACAQSGPPNLSVPADVVISSPGKDVPRDISVFVGKWGGYWGGKLPSILIIEKVTKAGEAEGRYIWGDAPEYKVRAGSAKIKGRIAARVLTWDHDQRTKFEFKANADGTLLGDRFVSGKHSNQVLMKRM